MAASSDHGTVVELAEPSDEVDDEVAEEVHEGKAGT